MKKKKIYNWKKIKLDYRVKKFFQLYVYSKEEYDKHGNENFWGEPRRFAAVSGYEAKQLANAANLKIGGELIDECLYIFRQSRTGRLVTKRVSMHPKTMANIVKGSQKYGSLHIVNELVNEGW